MNLPYYVHLPILVVVVSIVYAATRFEEWGNIFAEALRWGWRMLQFLIAIGIFLYIVQLFI